MLILNTDRHFNNLGIIADAAKDITGQLFAANLEVQADALGIGLQLNYKRLAGILEEMPSSRGLEVLQYQLSRYREIIPELK